GPLRDLGQDEDRRFDPSDAESEPLLDERDPEPGGSGLHRRMRDRDVPVAVRIGLHDGHQLDTVGLEGANVVTDRVEVYRHPRRTEAAHACLRTSSPASGSRSTTSPATEPSP